MRSLCLLRGDLGPSGFAMLLQLPLALVLEAGEAVLLVDQLRDGRNGPASFQLVVGVARREVVELGDPLENLPSLPESAVAEVVDVSQDCASDVVLLEAGIGLQSPFDAGEEHTIDAAPPEEQDNVRPAAGQQWDRVDHGLEDIGWVVEDSVHRHPSVSASTGGIGHSG